MSLNELVGSRPVPTISIDSHFANVPRLEEVRFDAVRCADLLAHPLIGIAERDLSRIHIYLRPDYELAYTRQERRALRKAHPDDYTDAASCEVLADDNPFGKRGDVLMTIVYGAGFGPNALLCHEGVHAQKKLDRRLLPKFGRSILASSFPKIDEHLDAIEEVKANGVMKDVALKGLRKGVIEVVREKRK